MAWVKKSDTLKAVNNRFQKKALMHKNTAFILAAGFGTRLRPLTLHRPKPLLPLLGKPMIDHALRWLQAHGHRRIMVNAHHLWKQVAEWAHQKGVEVQVELPDILGTGGGIKAASDRLADRFLIWNGDIICNIDPNQLLNATQMDGSAMALRRSNHLGKTTPLSVNEDMNVDKIGNLVEAKGAPKWETRPKTGLHFTGIHAMSRESLSRIPESPPLRCVIRSAYMTLVPELKAKAILHEGFWRDAGTPIEYLQANLDALSGELPLDDDAWADSTDQSRRNWIAQDAVIEGEVVNSIVGAGSLVPKEARITDCVVWDGAEVPIGKHRRCIFYDGGKLQVKE